MLSRSGYLHSPDRIPKIWSTPQTNSTRASIRTFLVYRISHRGPSNIRLRGLLSQLVVLPYVVWIFCIIGVVAIGLHDPLSISRKTFNCIVRNSDLVFVIKAYILICCISACILDGTLYDIGHSPGYLTTTIVLIAIDLHRNRHKIIAAGMDISLILRVMAFGVAILGGFVYDCLYAICSSHLKSSHSRLVCVGMKAPYSVIPDLCFSAFGIIFFFVFASQKDIIELWRCWSGPCINSCARWKTDMDFRAAALTNSGSSKTRRSSDCFGLTLCETIE